MIFAEYKFYSELGYEFKFNFDPMHASTLTITHEISEVSTEELCSVSLDKNDIKGLIKLFQAILRNEEEDAL